MSTWDGAVTISGKNITLMGAGRDTSILKRAQINITNTSSRITGFTMTDFDPMIQTGRMNGPAGFRVDHMTFRFTTSTSVGNEAVLINGPASNSQSCPTGLIDNNEFYNARVLVWGNMDLLNGASHVFSEETALGTDNAIFIENNYFERTAFGNAIDSNYGGRYVFRYNTVKNAYVELHGSANDLNFRGTRSVEIYGNKMHADGTVKIGNPPIRFIGGTGVVWGNTFTGTGWVGNHIGFYIKALINGDSPSGGGGSYYFDQPGRGRDSRPYTGGTRPAQNLEPVYVWNNTINGAPAPISFNSGASQYLKAGVDVINNTKKPGYSPYPYPHPLQSGVDTGSATIQAPQIFV